MQTNLAPDVKGSERGGRIKSEDTRDSTVWFGIIYGDVEGIHTPSSTRTPGITKTPNGGQRGDTDMAESSTSKGRERRRYSSYIEHVRTGRVQAPKTHGLKGPVSCAHAFILAALNKYSKFSRQ
jgi:hypothetical protein